MPQHYFHVYELSTTFLAYTVLVSYLLSTGALIVMVRDGFRYKTYGMPFIGIACMLAVSVMCVVGPFTSQSHLFFPKDNWKLLLTWGLDAVLLGVILWQYLRYGRDDAPPLGAHLDQFRLLTLLQVVVIFSGFWAFIVYFQDYYVNEICPLAILFMTAGYVTSLYQRRDLTGLSVPAGWMLGLSNLLLYGAVVAGNMSDPFPEAEYGYGFIYWMYVITLLLNAIYVAILPHRRRQTMRAAATAAGVL